MSALIVCSGSICDYSLYQKYIDKAQYIISVDGGALHTRKFDIVPHLLVGDFDSISSEELLYYKSIGVEIMEYPTQKDMTDTEIAVEEAIKRGYREIVIIGGVGSRLDHSLANIYLLRKMYNDGIKGFIVNENNEIFLTDSSITVEGEKSFKLSLLPLTEKVEGVRTNGLLYPLSDETLEMGESRGVSNEFCERYAQISVKKGILMVIKSKDV